MRQRVFDAQQGRNAYAFLADNPKARLFSSLVQHPCLNRKEINAI